MNRHQRSINVFDLQQRKDANLDELKGPLVMVEQYWSLDSYFLEQLSSYLDCFGYLLFAKVIVFYCTQFYQLVNCTVFKQ